MSTGNGHPVLEAAEVARLDKRVDATQGMIKVVAEEWGNILDFRAGQIERWYFQLSELVTAVKTRLSAVETTANNARLASDRAAEASERGNRMLTVLLEARKLEVPK